MVYNVRSTFEQIKTTKKCARKVKAMKKFYTIVTRLYVTDKDGNEQMLDATTQDFAYKARENAYKAFEDLKKEHINIGHYERTRSDFSLVKRSLETGQTYNLEFEIKEHYLSDYEQES